jgi:hypothetical protein
MKQMSMGPATQMTIGMLMIHAQRLRLPLHVRSPYFPRYAHDI